MNASVRLVTLLNRVFPMPPNVREMHAAKGTVAEYQAWEEADAHRVLPEFGRYWDIQHKDVLDVGCGLGGKTVPQAASGARSVTGIDLRYHSLSAARDLGSRRSVHNVRFTLSDSAHLPFDEESFDTIVSFNVFEHIDDPLNTLRECKRVLRPGGSILLHFNPFYSPWGAHLEGWINFPWPHVLFSDRTLLDAAQVIEDQMQRNTSYIYTAQVNWSQFEQLPELNRLTARRFLELIQIAGLQIRHVDFLPFGRHFLAKRGMAAQQASDLLHSLADLPGLREYVTAKMVFVLAKTDAP